MTMPCRNKKGFTLIEMLIAMTLGLLVIGAAIGVFNYSQNSYNVQEDIAAMQQDVRVAKTLIERDFRMAGTGLKEYPLIGSMTADDLEPIMFENNQGENGSDILTIRYLPPSPDPCGQDPDTGDSVDIPCSSLPDLHPLATVTAASSAVVVAESLTTSPHSSRSGACYCDNVTYASPQAIVVTTPSDTTPRVLEAAILDEVQSASDNLTIENQFANTFPLQSTIRFFNQNRTISAFKYFLRDGVLMREDTNNDPGNPQPIAEHIEDLQLAFGLDTDNDTVIDYWVDGSNSGDLTSNDLTDANKLRLKAVRLSVLGRTAKARRDFAEDIRPAVEDHAAADAADFHRRRLSQTTVELRNIEL